MKRLIIIGFLVCWANISFSQLKSYALRESLKIGEQTELIYEIKGKGEQPSISFPSKSGKILCENKNLSLEIIGVFNDTFIQKQDTWTWQGRYVVTAWDSGQYVVPSFSISLNKKVETFNNVTVNVTFPKVDKNGQIKDIKTIFTSIPSEFQTWLKKNYTWILWSILIVVVGVIVLIWLKRRKKKSPIETKKALSPAEIALQEIDNLIQHKFWIQNGEKEYYVRLSSILKTYLGANYQLSLSEKTSYEIQLLLSQVRLSKETLNDIQWVLQQADMVKFAKSEPSEIDMMKIGMSSKSIVEITSNQQR